MDARGIAEGELAEGCKRSTLEELTDWQEWAERTLVF
jgi:sulfur relay (sulfurtransferase) complex TusBCD TusD component (DsrE family)